MPQLPSAFTATDKEQMNDYSAIPAGEYIAQVTKSEIKNCSSTAKDPNGKYLALTFKLLDGKYKNRTFFTNLNLWNKNPQAVEIANKELATICKSVNLPGIKASEELHGKPLIIQLSCSAGDANNPPKNDIKFYKPMGGGPSKPDEDDKPAEAAGEASDTPEEVKPKKKKAWEE